MGFQRLWKKLLILLLKNTNGLHISFDLDVIDPEIAPGVTVKEKNGINLQETKEIINFLNTKNKYLKSFDLVEYNPLNDRNDATLEIANYILENIIKD